MTLAHDFNKFQLAVRDMALVFNTTLREDVIILMWQALKDLPVEDVQYRCAEWIKVGKFFPVPGQLREIPTPRLRGDTMPLGANRPCQECRTAFAPPRYDDGSAMRIFSCPACQEKTRG